MTGVRRPGPFIVLCAAGFFAIFSSTLSKSPALPLFASSLGAGPASVGMIAALSSFVGIIASIPAGILADRWGRRRVLLIGSTVFATAPLLYLAVGTLEQLAFVRLYHGIATALFVPAAMALVAGLFHAERGERLGWFSTATLTGRFIAPLAGGALIGAFAAAPGRGFTAVYLLCGAAGIAAFLLAFRIPAPARAPEAAQRWSETWAAFRKVIAHRGIVITSAVEAAVLFAYGTFETFLPLYAQGLGLSVSRIGLLLSAQVITLALTKPVMGRYSDRLSRRGKYGRQPQIVGGILIGALSLGLVGLFSSFLPLLFLGILFGLSLSLVTSASSALIADLSAKETQGSAMGVLGAVMDIGHTAGPLLMGMAAARYGFSRSFLLAALVLLLAGAVFKLTVGAKRPPAAH